VQYVRRVSRLWLLARRYGFDLLIAVGAVESALEVAFRHDAMQAPRTTLWFAVPAVAIVVLALLGRHRFPFMAPVSVWLLAAALSFVDGRLVVFSVSVYAAGMAAALLLGNLADAVQGRVGLAVVLGGAGIIVYNEPDHAAGDFIFVPVLFAIAWLAGFALRERAAQAEAAEERASHAEREHEENARRAVFEERVRIARELHDVVAHHVSMMGVQAGAARVVIDRDRVKAKEAARSRCRTARPPGTWPPPPPSPATTTRGRTTSPRRPRTGAGSTAVRSPRWTRRGSARSRPARG
jgi:signal transduction histidine kinase